MRATLPVPTVAMLAATLIFCLLPTIALAQGDAESRVQQLLTESYDDYDMLQLPAAEAKLQSAVELIEMAGVTAPVAAETWVMMGVVRYALTGAEEPVLNAFVQALLIDAEVRINPYYATPTLEAILDQARALVPASPAASGPDSGPGPGPTPGPSPGPIGPPPGPPASVVQHTPVQQAQAGRPIILSATVPVSVPVARVVVNFRPLGAPTFYAVELFGQPDGVSFLGEIPAEATSGPVQVDYYITVLDRAGAVLGTAGTPSQPFGVVVFGGLESPADDGRDRGRNASDERDEVFHFSMGGGSGFGLATSEPNVYADEVRINPGMAATPIHLGLELGFVPARAFHLVPFLRMQLVILESGIQPEPLFGLKARYFFRDEGPLRLYGQGSLGYGDVSHLVYLAEKDTYDTTSEGPFHIGIGMGLLYMFNDTVGLQNDVHSMVMLDRFSFQVDYTLGLYFAF